MTMITPSYLGETIEYSSLHACRSTLEDPTTASLYIDGLIDAEMASEGTLAASTDGLTMGAHPTNDDYLAGELQRVTVFDHALTSAQVIDRFAWAHDGQSSTSGVFEYAVDGNPSAQSRTASIVAANGTIPVTQSSPTTPTTSLTITSPFTGTTLNNPSNLTVQATLQGGTTITRVDFYADAILIGSATAAPYSVVSSALGDGHHALFAVATSDTNATFVSAPIFLDVTHDGVDAGTLGEPIAVPPAGTYTGTQSVSLVAGDGAIVHYTLDGSDPTDQSPTYSAPIAISATTTLTARAFQDGWTLSDATVADYMIDSTATPAADTRLLEFTVADTSRTNNLTSALTLDWVDWGRYGIYTLDRKAAIAPLISDFGLINADNLFGFDDAVSSVSWSDGDGDPASASDLTTGVGLSDTGGGFEIVVPADTTTQTLTLAVSATNATATLIATLGYGADAATVMDTSIDTFDHQERMYQIHYRARTAGETLTILFVKSADHGTADDPGAIGLQAAVVIPHLPAVSLEMPAAGAAFVSPADVILAASATQAERTIDTVTISTSTNTTFDVTDFSHTAVWTTVPSGHYSMRAVATDLAGLTGTSTPREIDVIGGGGTLTGSLAILGSTPIYDLTTEGTGDWILWGVDQAAPFSRKFGVGAQISPYTPIGNHRVYPFDDGRVVFQYRDGDARLARIVSASGVQVFEAGNGFELTVPAVTSTRTLRLYVGAEQARGRVTAFLSDGSAQVFASTLDGASDPIDGVYAVSYRSTSDGQTLTIRYTLDLDYGHGSILLEAASLDGAPVVAASITSVSTTVGGIGAQGTITGTNFGSQQNDSALTIGGVAVQVTSWSDTQIDFTVAQPVRSGALAVGFGGGGGAVTFSRSFDFRLGRRQEPQAVYITPDEVTLSVGDVRPLKLVDGQGNTVDNVTWSVDDQSVAIVTTATDAPASDPATNPPTPLLQGRSDGTVTITAVSALGTVQATARVFTTIPEGTALWAIYPDSVHDGFVWPQAFVKGQPKGPNDPTYFTGEYLDAGGASIRALDAGGQQLWRTSVPTIAGESPFVGTADAGLLVATAPGLVKLAPSGEVAWTHEAGAAYESIAAVGYDGTIYGHSNQGFTVWDGATGAVRYTVPQIVPTGTFTVHGNPEAAGHNIFWDPVDCEPYNSASPPPPIALPSNSTQGFVGATGHFFIAYSVQEATFLSDTRCSMPTASYDIPLIGSYSTVTTTYVAEFTPTAPGSVTVAAQDSETVGGNAPTGSEDISCSRSFLNQSLCELTTFGTNWIIPSTLLEQMSPDSGGGVLISRSVQPKLGFATPMLTRVRDGAALYDVPNPTYDGGISGFAISETGAAVVSRGTMSAVDPETGSLLWETMGAYPGDVLTTTDDGKTIAKSGRYESDRFVLQLATVDASGVVTGQSDVPGHWDYDNDIDLFDGARYVAPGALMFESLSGPIEMIGTTVIAEPGMLYPSVDIGSPANEKSVNVSVKEYFNVATGYEEGLTGFDRTGRHAAVMVPQPSTDGITGLHRFEYSPWGVRKRARSRADRIG